MTLEELFMQGMGLLPALQQKEDMINQLKELVDTKKQELKLYEQQLKELKQQEEQQLGEMRDEMERKGLNSLDLGGLKISLVAGRESVQILEGVELDNEFVRVREEPAKKKVMDYYKETGLVPAGFTISKGKKQLKITKRKVDDD